MKFWWQFFAENNDAKCLINPPIIWTDLRFTLRTKPTSSQWSDMKIPIIQIIQSVNEKFSYVLDFLDIKHQFRG